MGVLNVTPDSFSDGGHFGSLEAAVKRGVELVSQGADLLDIGGESTRPGAIPVSEGEEMARVLPVVEQLSRLVPVPLSIDTSKAAVALAALAAGASIVNDVAATNADPAMARAVAETGAGYVAVHMQGTPESMQLNPRYTDVVGAVKSFFTRCLQTLSAGGVHPEQVVLDVGIGFGKTLTHNLQLLARIGQFRELERPLLLGVSRKSFMARIVEAPVHARLAGSLAAACLAVERGVSIVRAHDVAETLQALRVTEAILVQQNA